MTLINAIMIYKRLLLYEKIETNPEVTWNRSYANRQLVLAPPHEAFV